MVMGVRFVKMCASREKSNQRVAHDVESGWSSRPPRGE